MKARYYQAHALKNLETNIDAGKNDNLVVIPVGGGKSIVIAHNALYAIRRKPGSKVILLAHRKELSTQNAEKLLNCDPTLSIGFEKAQEKCTPENQIMVASVQTIGKEGLDRVRAWSDLKNISAVLIDEAHHIPGGKTYQILLAELRAENPDVIITGFTATPTRGDGERIDAYIANVAYEITMQELVEAKYLARLNGIKVKTETSLSEFKGNKRKDFDDSALAKLVDNDARNQLALDVYMAKHQGEAALAFCVTKAHAESVAGLFIRAGIKAGCITDDTPPKEREALIKGIKSGEIHVLASVGVLCLDQETEILTRTGWKNYKTLKAEDKVGNWDNGKIWFEKPLETYLRDRYPDEEMFSTKSNRLDIRVTKGHKMLYRTVRTGKFKKTEVEKLAGKKFQIPTCGQKTPERKSVKQPNHYPNGIKRAIAANSYVLRKNGMNPEAAKELATQRINEKLELRHKNPWELTESECKIIGFWIGDGSKDKLQSGGVEYILHQTERYPKVVNEIRKWLKDTGWDHIERKVSIKNQKDHWFNPIRWSIPRGTGFGPQKRVGIFSIEPYLNKSGTDLFWSFNKKQVGWLLEGFCAAEGEHNSKNYHRSSNTNKPLVDLLQALAVCNGLTCNQSLSSEARNKKLGNLPLYILGIHKRQGIFVSRTPIQKEEEWKEEKVWCVKTTSGNIITRRRGRVTVMGNCEGFDCPIIKCLLMLRPTKSPVLFEQMIGRALRLIAYPDPNDPEAEWVIDWERKSFATVYDFVDQEAIESGAYNLAKMVGLNPDFDISGKDVFAVKSQIDAETQGEPLLAAALQSCRTPEEIEKLLSSHDLLAEMKSIRYTPNKENLGWMAIDAEKNWIQLGKGEVAKIEKNALGTYVIHMPKIDLAGRHADRVAWEAAHPDPKRPPAEEPEFDYLEPATHELDAENMDEALEICSEWLNELLPGDRALLDQNAPWKTAAKKEAATEGQRRIIEKLNLGMSAEEWANLNKADASDIITKSKLQKSLMESEGRINFGKYKGVPAMLIRIHTNYIGWMLKNRSDFLRQSNMLATFEAAESETPIPWLATYRPHIYQKDFAGMEEFYEKSFAKNPEDVRAVVKFALEQDPTNQWPLILKRTGGSPG